MSDTELSEESKARIIRLANDVGTCMNDIHEVDEISAREGPAAALKRHRELYALRQRQGMFTPRP